MSTQTLQHLRRSGPGIYEITDPVGRLLSPQSVSAAQIRLFLAYDAHLRSGADRSSVNEPLGYGDFADVYNLETVVATRFAVPHANNNVAILGPSPSCASLLGNDTTGRDVPDARAAREADGGMWLDKRKVGLLNESLWTTLEVATRKKEREDKFRAEQREKKRTRQESGQSGHHPLGPMESRRRRIMSQNADAAPEASSSGSQPAGAQHTPGRAGPSSMDVDQPSPSTTPDQPLADPKNKGKSVEKKKKD
ncbi:hypothetical protein BU15DRAFT_59029 [Melanogaster broomeanus]|nr:hypothetical protein BU15DRAFT_59029 [Melanogaster broomeanus]